MTVTIRDVAKMAGVSISTVSRVINKSKPVSPEATKRVLKAVDELNYVPNQIARSLVTQKSNIIGVIVDDLGLSYVSQVIRGVEEVARMYNYDIIVSSSYGDPDMEERLIRVLMQKQVEGIVVISEKPNKNRSDNLNKLKVPIHYVNRYYRNPLIPTTTIDNKKETKRLTEKLMDNGHKNIVYLSSSQDLNSSNEKFKREGYQEAMEENELSPRILTLDGVLQDPVKVMSEDIVKEVREGKITAIVAYCHEIAVDLMNCLYDDDVSVPDDVSIVAIGDGILAQTYRPRLTVVREPLYDYGAVSTRSIIKIIRDEEQSPKDTMILPAEIIDRESVKKLD